LSGDLEEDVSSSRVKVDEFAEVVDGGIDDNPDVAFLVVLLRARRSQHREAERKEVCFKSNRIEKNDGNDENEESSRRMPVSSSCLVLRVALPPRRSCAALPALHLPAFSSSPAPPDLYRSTNQLAGIPASLRRCIDGVQTLLCPSQGSTRVVGREKRTFLTSSTEKDFREAALAAVPGTVLY
jgi:hypothetical protein